MFINVDLIHAYDNYGKTRIVNPTVRISLDVPQDTAFETDGLEVARTNIEKCIREELSKSMKQRSAK